MVEEPGINSKGEYASEIDPRYDPLLMYIIPEDEYTDEGLNAVGGPTPATTEDILVDPSSDEFREKYWGRLMIRTQQSRINPETGNVHPCIYIKEVK